MIFSAIIPQDLSTTASPTFAGLYVTGTAGIGAAQAANVGLQCIVSSNNANVKGINLSPTATLGTGTTTSLFGVDFTATYQPASPNANRVLTNMYGGNAVLFVQTAAGANFNSLAFAARCYYARIQASEGGGGTGVANVTTGTMFYADTATKVAGAITNLYAFFDNGQTAASTLNYGIYTKTVANVIGAVTGGMLAIGKTTAPTVALDVVGAGLFSTTLGVTGLSTMTGGILIAAAGNIEKQTNDLTLTTASQKTLVLSQPVYKDINLAGALLVGNPTVTPGEVEFLDDEGDATGVFTYGFAEDEGVHGGLELQHDYKEGTDLVFHVHWQGIAAPTGTDNVQWRLTYLVAREEVVLADSVTIDSPDTPFDTQYECKRTNFAAITGTNFKIGDQFMFSLFRVAATGDAYAGDALIMTAGIHYQIDTIGSRQIATK